MSALLNEIAYIFPAAYLVERSRPVLSYAGSLCCSATPSGHPGDGAVARRHHHYRAAVTFIYTYRFACVFMAADIHCSGTPFCRSGHFCTGDPTRAGKIGKSRSTQLTWRENPQIRSSVSGIDHPLRCHSMCAVSASEHGALIILQRDDSLEDFARTGVRLNASVTPELLLQIFYPNTPLHDGAVIINNNQIIAGACVMPLSASGILTRSPERAMGLRHRAALGTSEATDAIAVVVSEETGSMSIAHNGRMIRRLDSERLENILSGILPAKRKRETKRAPAHFIQPTQPTKKRDNDDRINYAHLPKTLPSLFIAFLLAIAVWVMAINSSDPSVENVYPNQVPIEVVGQATETVINTDPLKMYPLLYVRQHPSGIPCWWKKRLCVRSLTFPD